MTTKIMIARIIIKVIAVIALILIIAGVIYVRNNEKKIWNNGKCSKCSGTWVLHDMDSQGSRMYVCNNCRKIIWISYNVDNFKL